jgi:cytosine/creatinine deaminase
MEGFRPGAPADMIVERARDFTELMARPHNDRVVLRHGRALGAGPPDFADIDALEGLSS